MNVERVCPLRHCPCTAGSYLGARPPRAVLAPHRRPDQGHLPKVGMRRVAVVFVLVRAAVCVAAEPGVPLTIPGSGSLIVRSPTVAELLVMLHIRCWKSSRTNDSTVPASVLLVCRRPRCRAPRTALPPTIPRVVAEVPSSMTTLCHDTLLSASDTMNLVTAWGGVAILEPQASNEESCYSLSVVRSPIV